MVSLNSSKSLRGMPLQGALALWLLRVDCKRLVRSPVLASYSLSFHLEF